VIPIVRRAEDPSEQQPLPVVLTPDSLTQAAG
jgi:hypothetical protein